MKKVEIKFIFFSIFILGYIVAQNPWEGLVSPTNQSGVFQGQATINDSILSSDDWVAAFDGEGNCAGATEITMVDNISYINLVIYGDDGTTPDIDEGMNAGEDFVLRLWDSSTNTIYEYSETFDCWYNNNGAPMIGCGDINTVYNFVDGITPSGWTATITASGEGVEGEAIEYDLTFGFHPDATDGYDADYDMYAPPAPPPPAFDAALVWDGDRYYTQILAFDGDNSEHEYDISLAYGSDNMIDLTWDNTGWSDLMSSCVLQDAFGGLLGIDIDMLSENSLSLTNPAFTSLKLNVTPADSGSEVLIPELSILSPLEGQTFTSNEIDITLSGENLNEGDHYHVYVNEISYGDYTAESFTILTTGTGSFSISAIVASESHEEYTNPEASDTVNIIIEETGYTVDYLADIQPVFNNNCTGCHGGSGGLYLSEGVSYDNLVNVASQGYAPSLRVEPGSAANSVLWNKVAGTGLFGAQMPLGGSPLSQTDINTIELWINEGANYTPPPANTPPVAGFSWSAEDLLVIFQNTSTDADGDILDFSWDFGDGNSSTDENPTHTYADGGTYIVSLTAGDETDNDTYWEEVTVSMAPEISVTPDSLFQELIEGQIATQTLTISNTGEGPLEVELIIGIVVTDIDHNVYEIVEIGEQVWMKENLKVTHYNDGSEIPTGYSSSNWENLSTGAYAVYDNNENNADTYGYLYNWYAVDDSRGVCPEGWNVPTDDEYTTLTDYLGGEAGGKMKECTEGSCPDSEYWISPNTGATNESRFTGLPGGYRGYSNGNYNYMSFNGYFWSSTSTELNSNNAWNRLLYYSSSNITRSSYSKKDGFSVRCVRDADYLTISNSDEPNNEAHLYGDFSVLPFQTPEILNGEGSQRDTRNGWLTIDPSILTITPNSSADVLVTMNAEGLDYGDYSDIITIISNDPDEPMITVPVVMGVNDPPYSGPTWHVSTSGSDDNEGSESNPFATIQHGIDVSSDSDTVLVSSGTYYENINIANKDISLIGEDIATTIIDGGQNTYSLQILGDGGNISENILLQNFTIQNGAYSGVYISGIEESNIENCNIKNNTSPLDGGGISIENSNNIILSNLDVSQNSTSTENARGGGIYIMGSTGITIINSIINENNAIYSGGGISASAESSIAINNCEISNNSSSRQGGAIDALQSNLTLINTKISNNTSHFGGGGIHINQSNINIYESILDSNSTQGAGGAIFIDDSNSNFENVTIVNNNSDSYGGGAFIVLSDANLKNCIFWDNLGNSNAGFTELRAEQSIVEIIYSLIQDPWEGEGNIDVDPLFTDPENGDYTLQFTSPCIDTGNPDLDGDGDNYLIDSDDQDPDGTRLDIGAYYFDQIEFPIIYGCMDPGASNYNSEAVIDDGSCVNDGPIYYISTEGNDFFGIGTEQNPYLTIQKGIDVASDGDTVLIFSGIYSGTGNKNIYLTKDLKILSESGPAETVIDCGSDDNAFDFNYDCCDSTEVSGFTIRNGYAHEGSALFFLGGVDTSTVIKNCVFENCVVTGTNNGIITLDQSSPKIINCTFIGNSGNGNPGQSLIKFYYSNSIIRNNLIWGNDVLDEGSLSIIVNQEGSYPTIEYNDIEYSNAWHSMISDGNGNIDSDPLFTDIDNGDYTLQWGSPCIDAGDPESPLDPDGTIVDMGAYYFDQSSIVLGCMDSSADNYNLSANIDDGTCEYTETVEMTDDGSTVEEENITSESGDVELTIDSGTQILLDGEPVTDDVVITVSEVTPDSVATVPQTLYEGVSNIVAFEPFGLTFSQPVEISISYTSARTDYYLMSLENPADSSWSSVSDASCSDGSCTADVSSFGLYSVFTMLDPEPPEISITSVSSTNVGTSDQLTVSWSLSYNFGVDSAFIDLVYPDETIRVSELSAENGQATIDVPDSSIASFQLKVTIIDLNQTEVSALSESIGVFDNTTPNISLIAPSDTEFEIGANIEISWSANDNIGVTNVSLSYSADNGNNWSEISVIEFGLGVNSYSWFIPNTPSDEVVIRSIVQDDAGLQDTSIVSNLSIVISYPTLLLSPETLNWGDNEISIIFSQLIDETTLTQGNITFSSGYSNEVTYNLDYDPDSSELTITLSSGFASVDTVTLTLNAENITNMFGYGLDENGDGDPGDDFTYQYITPMLADFDNSNSLDLIDLTTFITNFENKVYDIEIGPVTGSAPHYIVSQDSKYDIEDIMVFVLMWNWYVSTPMGKIQFRQWADSGKEITIESSHEQLVVSIPSGAIAYEVQVSFEPGNLIISAPETNDGIRLTDLNEEEGVFTLMGSFDEIQNIILPIQINGRNSDISISVRVTDNENEIMSQSTKQLVIQNIPREFTLYQNYPNPFNPITTLRYDLPSDALVTLTVYDMLGREIVQLVNTTQQAGFKSVQWDATDSMGKPVSAGVYLYQIQAGEFVQTKKMVLLK